MLGLGHREAAAHVAAEERVEEAVALRGRGVLQQDLHVARVRRLRVADDVAERARPERLADAPELRQRQPEPARRLRQLRVPQPGLLRLGARGLHARFERVVVVGEQVRFERAHLVANEGADAREQVGQVVRHRQISM